jgi:DNA-binding NarL/FixJ family response regulator
MLTSSESIEDLQRAADAGAKAYVLKNIGYRDLVALIKDVHAGGCPIGRDLERRSAEAHQEGPLSPREIEVLGLLRQGFTNIEIANLLGFSERTARFHVTSIKEKLGCAHRAEAVAKGFELGLLKVAPAAPRH